MIRKTTFISAISCLLFPLALAASTDKPDGWYIKGAYDNFLSSPNYPNLSMVAGSIGYKQGILRVEGQAGYAHVTESLCYGEDCQEIGRGNNINLGLHGFIDWDNHTFLSPYIGAGLEKSNYFLASQPNSGRLRGVGLAGARAYLSDNFAVDIGYKTDLAWLSNGGTGSIGLVYQFK